MKKPTAKVKERPAESAGLLGAVVFAVGRSLGWSPEVTNAIAIVAPALPAVVTFIVARVKAAA